MAKASILKFEFKVIGATLNDCQDTLDEIVQKILVEEGGEPWVTITDSYSKVMLSQAAALSGDPNAFIYEGLRTVLFTGPTKLGGGDGYRDGFRPQADLEDGLGGY